MRRTFLIYALLATVCYSCGTGKNAPQASTDDPFALLKTPVDSAHVHYIKKGGKDFVYLAGNNLKDYTVVTKENGLALNVRGYNIKGKAVLSSRSNYLSDITTATTSDGSRVDLDLKKKQGFRVYRRPSGLVLAMGPGYQEIAEDDLEALDSEVSNSAGIDEDLDSLLVPQKKATVSQTPSPANVAQQQPQQQAKNDVTDEDLDKLLNETNEENKKNTAQSELDQMPAEGSSELAVAEQGAVEGNLGKPAVVKGIKVNKLYDRTELIVQADRTIKYERKPSKTGYNQVIVDIPNATLSQKFNKRLDLSANEGVVASITSTELKGPYKAVRVTVQLNNEVEPEITQNNNTISLSFPFSEEINIAEGPKPGEVNDVEAARQFSRMSFEDYLAKPTTFYGSRMSIEVSNANILDVLRMIQEVSGINIVVSEKVKGKVDVSLKNVPWDQALSVVLQNAQLGYVRQGSVIRVAPLADLRDERKLAAEALEAHNNLEPIRVMVAKLNYIGAKEAEDKVTSLLSKRGRVSVDKDAKTIVVNDIEDVILKADKMLKAIDTRPIQVAIEANVIEASEAWIRAMGFSWATGAGDISFKSISGYGNIGATIGLASLHGDVKIISSPKICALDRQTASILQGTQVAYKTSMAGASGELSDKIEFENIEVVLNVTPRVTANNEIILDVNVKREFPDYTNRMNKNVPPGVGVRKASSQIMLKDGETAVIGGLYSLDTGDANAGVPLMKKIPIIGIFFGKQEDREMRSELLIFIKAKIKTDQTALAGM
jgi:type IV pilus assembly protein PilQ